MKPAEYAEYLRHQCIGREVRVGASESRNSRKSKTRSKKEEKEKKETRTGSQDPPALSGTQGGANRPPTSICEIAEKEDGGNRPP